MRDVFGHMGLTDKDIVALSGGHTLVCFLHLDYAMLILLVLFCPYCTNFAIFNRVGATRSVLALRAPGPATLLSLIIHISSKRNSIDIFEVETVNRLATLTYLIKS